MSTNAPAASRFLCTAALVTLLQPSAYAALSAVELAKLAQNPVGNLVSIPIQNNTNLNFGPENKTQNVANIQPVIPVSVNGNRNWGVGPLFVGLHLNKGDPWVYGALISNVWSTSSSHDPSYNNGVVQPFLNYNFHGGFYLTSSPIITVNWKAQKSSDEWTVPVGGGVGKIFHFGKLPLNTQLATYYNTVRPDDGADWQIRFQIQAMFPKL